MFELQHAERVGRLRTESSSTHSADFKTEIQDDEDVEDVEDGTAPPRAPVLFLSQSLVWVTRSYAYVLTHKHTRRRLVFFRPSQGIFTMQPQVSGSNFETIVFCGSEVALSFFRPS